MSNFKTNKFAAICALVVFTFLTLFCFPYGPSLSNNFVSTVKVALPNDASQAESLPVVPVDLFGVESNLIGSPTPKFKGTSYHSILKTFRFTV